MWEEAFVAEFAGPLFPLSARLVVLILAFISSLACAFEVLSANLFAALTLLGIAT